MSTLALDAGGNGPDRGELARWGAALALVLGLHIATVAVLLASRTVTPEAGEALPAVMVDLAPPPAAPTAVPAETPPSEAVAEMTAPNPAIDAPAEPPDPVVPPPEPPPPKEAPAAAVALPPPPPKVVPKPQPKEKVERKPPKPVQAKMGERHEEKRPPVAEAGAPDTSATASTSSGSAAASRSSWQGALVAHLRRHLQPQNGQTGSASVRFTMNRSGGVLATALVGSAGSAALDGEALAVFRRAQPLPAAPADVPGSTFTFTIPVRFTSR